MKTKAITSEDEKTKIPAQEYDFREVPEQERDACCYYEYARESLTVQKRVRAIRQATKLDEPYRRSHGPWSDADHKRLFLARCNDFPNTPWQSLKTADRDDLRDLIGDSEKMFDLRMYTVDEFQPVETAVQFLIDLNDPPLRTGVFCLNTGQRKKLLRQAFEKWLDINCPDSKPKRVGRIHRSVDGLRMLGVLRLRKHCKTLTEAQTLLRTDKVQGIGYSDRSAWNRACGDAVERFQSILALPPSEFPICYTKGWRK